jgi:hypothetical protein
MNNMLEIKATTLTNASSQTKVWAQSLALITVIGILPFFIHLQWITGPLVNAALIVILFLFGRKTAMIAAFVPSIMALSGGLLPIALAPLVPFIIVSNIILILVIERLTKNKSYSLAAISGAVAKFIFLALSAKIVVMLLQKAALIKVLSTLFGVTQLYSALLGGLIALVVLKWMKRV